MAIRKKALILLIATLVPLAIFLAGPRPSQLHLDPAIVPQKIAPEVLEKFITEREQKISNLKPDNQARIIWADSTRKQKTPYCIVYLHGFSASWKEGDPVHRDIAKKYSCNLYLTRLYAHGIADKEPLLALEANAYLESAKQAIAEAQNLGEKVIIMSTSTGSTLGLYLAAHNPEISALILYSPNIKLYDSKSFILTMPWGLYLARSVTGGQYLDWKGNEEIGNYWNLRYRLEALVTLKNLLKHTMTPETFSKVKQPTLLCYFYKNEEEQDHVVSVPAMLRMYDQLGTSVGLKQKVVIPNAGGHAIASELATKDIKGVEKATSQFLEEILGLVAK